MSDPWAVPPLPTKGDDEEEWTYAAVGRVLSRWESIEARLARLYSVFVGNPDDGETMRQYGVPKIFRERAAQLVEAADRYWRRSSNQAAEGDFDKLVDQIANFSDRRNEIAHGVVDQIQHMRFFKGRLEPDAIGKMQYALVPPFHTLRKFETTGAPSYAYTSTELLKLEDRLFVLAGSVREYEERLLPPEKR